VLLDLLIGLIVFLGFCFYYEFTPDYRIFFTPIIVLLTYMAATGIGLFAAVLNVKYRDIGQLIPFVVSFGLFISPVLYTTDMVKGHWVYNIYVLNPVAGGIDAFRWAVLGDYSPFNWDSFLPLLIFCAISMVVSVGYFRKHESSFVDYI
jgi:lipopolysaccharide transport system permease protein